MFGLESCKDKETCENACQKVMILHRNDFYNKTSQSLDFITDLIRQV